MKKFLCITLSAVLCITALCACSLSDNKPAEVGFEAMDTFMSLKIYGQNRDSVLKNVQGSIVSLDKLLSTTDKNSDIYKLNNAGAVPVEVDKTTADIVEMSLDLCDDVSGALDITVYPVVCEWGFIDKDYKIPDQNRIEQLLQFVDYSKVSVSDGKISLLTNMQIDLGAVAKGYAADRGIEICRNEDITSALLNLGGTVAAIGAKPDGSDWKVGVADPENSADYFGYLSCKDKVIATSGGYERYFIGSDGKTYIHIINPKTGSPVDNNINSVTIVSEVGIKSDALSTALFVMGVDDAEKYRRENSGFDYVILTKDNEVYVTSGIYDSFTLADNFKNIKVNIVD